MSPFVKFTLCCI